MSCEFCEWRDKEYFEFESRTLAICHGDGETIPKKVSAEIWLQADDSTEKYKLTGILSDAHGVVNGADVEIHYCPFCGEKLNDGE